VCEANPTPPLFILLRVTNIRAPSSASADLQRCLESRLRRLTEGCGSPLYVLTWKHWDMPLGLPISALRASVRRTSDSDCTGWPTPMTNDSPTVTARAPENLEIGRRREADGLADTPKCRDTKRTYGSQHNAFIRWERNPYPSPAVYAKALETPLSGSPAEMGSGGQLNPELARCLMRFPVGWSSFAATAARSIRTKARRS